MADIFLNLIFVVFSIILAIFGAIVGAWLQHRYWIRQNQENSRTERKNAAFAVAHRTAELIDKRIHRQRRILWAVLGRNPAEIENERLAYKAAVDEWMASLGRIKAELWTSFGKTESFSFEEDIHDLLAANGRKIELSIRNNSITAISGAENELNIISYRSFLYIQNLLSRAQNENIRGLENRNALLYSNWENLSYHYLFSRLFGLVGPQ
jgi:hypothetical protein